MNDLERFNALIGYIRDHPEAMARHGASGVAVMKQIMQACAARDGDALDRGITAFLDLTARGQAMRGIKPSTSSHTVEQFNRIENVVKTVLDKIERDQDE